MNLLKDFPEVSRQHVPLAPHTWFKLGGPAEYFVEPRDANQLAEIIRRCRENGLGVRFLGLGANILVADEGVRGAVIRLSSVAFNDISHQGAVLRCGGGVDMTSLVKWTVRHGLAGLEQLSGIPGTVGGGVSMNCGGKYGDLSQALHSVAVIEPDGTRRNISRDQLHMGYRECELHGACVVEAQFHLQQTDPVALQKRFREIWEYKQATQPPLGESSVGCIFRNPQGNSAGRLIDQAGLKGVEVGSAYISPKHANFILARREGKSSDVLKLIRLVQQRVAEHSGMMLEPEVRIWSDHPQHTEFSAEHAAVA